MQTRLENALAALERDLPLYKALLPYPTKSKFDNLDAQNINLGARTREVNEALSAARKDISGEPPLSHQALETRAKDLLSEAESVRKAIRGAIEGGYAELTGMASAMTFSGERQPAEFYAHQSAAEKFVDPIKDKKSAEFNSALKAKLTDIASTHSDKPESEQKAAYLKALQDALLKTHPHRADKIAQLLGMSRPESERKTGGHDPRFTRSGMATPAASPSAAPQASAAPAKKLL